jgi:hypothetical protein
MPLVSLKSWGALATRGLCPLKLFFSTVGSEDFAKLSVSSLRVGVLLPDSPESQILSHGGGEATCQTDQKSVPM